MSPHTACAGYFGAATTPFTHRLLYKVNASRLLAPALLLCASSALADTPPDDALRAAVKKSLTYLADGGRDWMEGRSCASCHHAPMMIWGLHHAKKRGFEVDEKTLAEVTAWTLDPKVNLMPKPAAKQAHEAPNVLPAKGEPEAKKEEEKTPEAAKEKEPTAKKLTAAEVARAAEEALSEANVAAVVAYYALATDRAEPPPVPADMHAKMIQHFLDKQEAGGAWNTYVAHPPILESGENSTLYVLVALLGKDGKAEPAGADWGERKARALKYLASVKPNAEVQSQLWRLLLRKLLGASDSSSLGGSQEADSSAVLSQQHPDGGWGQSPALPSDAYATGQVLYFLDAAGCEMDGSARDKAVAFLLQTQKTNGSWPMKSRNRTAPKATAGAKDLEIIGYAGTAWAAMGLVSAAGKAK